MATVPIHEQALVQGGNSVFEDVWITDTLHYDFKRSGDVGFSTITVDGAATFSSDVSFAGDITLDEITCRNADVTGIATVKDLVVKEKLRDGDGNFGTSGQLLSSDGTDLVWINANTTSVANATNVGVNVNGDNSNQFISFFGASSGNRPNRVDADLRYNPSTNTMSGINYSGTSTFNNTRVTGITTTGILEVEGELRDGDGNFGTSGQILSSDGTDTKWINTGSLTAGAASEVGVTAVNTNAAHFITFVGSSSGNENIEVDTNLTYNPSTNILSATVSGSGANLTSLNASNLGSGTIPDARFPSTLPVANGSNLTSLDASNLSSGTIPDDRFPSTLPALDGSNLTNIPVSPSDRIFENDASVECVDVGIGTHIKVSLSGQEKITVDANGHVRVFAGVTTTTITDQQASFGTVNLVPPEAGGTAAINVVTRAVGAGQTNIVMRSISSQSGWAGAEFRAENYSFKIRTTERFRFGFNGELGIGLPNSSPNYGTVGQVLKSQGAGAGVEWGSAGMSHSNKTSSYTLTASDDNRLITTTSNVTIPSGVFSAANGTTIYNNSSSTISIVQGSGVTLETIWIKYITGTRSLVAERCLHCYVCSI